MEGYSFSPHFLELPYWINIISGMLKDNYEKELFIITNIEEVITKIKNDDYVAILFSVMNVNEQYVLEIVTACNDKKFLLGGYTDKSRFSGLQNAAYFSSVNELATGGHLLIDVESPPEYSLFMNDFNWIPRITLSSGCKHTCKFCAVPRELSELPEENIVSQVKALSGLKFRLIYVDDKTFGQAENYRILKRVYDEVVSYNSNFLGFIVQTTASLLSIGNGHMLHSFINELHVKYIEIGVETCDDNLLEELRKPHRMKHIRDVCDRIRQINNEIKVRNAILPTGQKRDELKLIPNILFGIKGDTYQKTIEFIEENLDIIPTVNYANISGYPGQRGDGYLPYKNPADGDDYAFEKTWLLQDQVDRGKRALERIVSFFGVVVKIP